MGITSLIEELHENEQNDFEGDRTYRVHIETAERIIKKAYNRGIYDTRKVAPNKKEIEKLTKGFIVKT